MASKRVHVLCRAFGAVAALAFAVGMANGFAAAHAQTPRLPSTSRASTGTIAPAVEDSASVLAVVYSQPPNPAGGLLPSSVRDPDGGATDQWVWDSFVLGTASPISEVRWRGAYDPTRFGAGGPVRDFTVEIYPSNPAGSQPDVVHPPLAHYAVGGNAGETPADVLGGMQTYDYRFILPAPFQAAAGTKYWVQIEALQSGTADWGLVKGTGGNGQHFQKVTGNSSIVYQTAPGDAAFTLLAPGLGGHWSYLPSVSRSAAR